MENNQPNKRLSLSPTSALLIIMTVVSQQTKNLLTNPIDVAQVEIKRRNRKAILYRPSINKIILADYIVGEVTSFPQNEAIPEADILIILGRF